jgi:hypothetical protein
VLLFATFAQSRGISLNDLEQTAAWLEEHDVPYSRDRRGAIGIVPKLTHGVMLEFVAGATTIYDSCSRACSSMYG